MSTFFDYDAGGNLTRRVDAEENATRYAYDGRGRKILIEDPDLGVHRFVFDAASNMLRHEFPDGKSNRFEHDLAGRTVAEYWDGDDQPEVRRTYDEGGESNLGQLFEVTDPSARESYLYDSRQRKIGRSVHIAGNTYSIGFGYDASDRLVMRTYPDGSSIELHHNKRGLITRYGEDAVRLDYDADGRLLRRRYATGVEEEFAFDEDGRAVEHRALSAGGSVIQHLRWTLDEVGNMLAQDDLREDVGVDRTRSSKAKYDNLYRLTHASGGWAETRWDYSLSGNIISRISSEPRMDAGQMSYGGQGRATRADADGGTRSEL